MPIILEVITFVVVLVVLVLVHEIGHFIVAKLSGMRVDEFGIGYPPRALTLGKIGDTEYTLNWLPFGGFVRIYGEDGETELVDTKTAELEGTGAITDKSEMPETMVTSEAKPRDPRAFSSRPRILQALTLIAGVAMNFLLAYLLFTYTQAVGVEQQISPDQMAQATNVHAALESVRPGSPADKAGFKAGDIFTSESILRKTLGIEYHGTDALGYTTLISIDKEGDPMEFIMKRGNKLVTIMATPQKGIIADQPNRPALGFTLTDLGTLKVPLSKAPVVGAQITWNATKQTAVGLYGFFKNIVLLKADLSQVSGPVGIAGVVGTATAVGFTTLLSLVALISINLGIINLIPIPALDGGRLLFVIIESIIRRPINPKIAERVNMVGFALLLLLMVVVTAHDIYKLIF
jgi:regulator of sigma E protease